MSIQSCGRSQRPLYNLSVVVGPQFYWSEGAKRFAELVKTKTNGKINIKPYYGGELFKGQQTSEFQLLSQGVIDFAWGSTINWSTVIKELNLFSLPFFINDFDSLDRLESGETGKKLFALLEDRGVKPLSWAENGFRQLTNSKRAINRPSDIAGLKIRVVGSPIFIDIFKTLRADPVSMNWGDAIAAFSQGVVDGQENPTGILVPVHIWEYHKHLFMWNYVVDPIIVAVNKERFDKMPPDIQQVIMSSAEEAARWEKAVVRCGFDNGTSIKILQDEFHYSVPSDVYDFKSKGMTITTPTNKTIKEFRNKLQSVYDRWIPTIGEDIYNDAMNDMNL